MQLWRVGKESTRHINDWKQRNQIELSQIFEDLSDSSESEHSCDDKKSVVLEKVSKKVVMHDHSYAAVDNVEEMSIVKLLIRHHCETCRPQFNSDFAKLLKHYESLQCHASATSQRKREIVFKTNTQN